MTDRSIAAPPRAGPATRGAAPDRWLADPVECGPAAGFGVYLHVPFCEHRCGYCDFATYDDRDHLIDRYVAALRSDLGRVVAAGPAALDADGAGPAAVASDRPGPDAWPRVTSVFVGGGTPTLLDPDDLAGLVRLVRRELDVAPGAEITVEANPETASVELFGRLADAGVTRVSLGAQSFVPELLSTLERRHTPERPAEAVRQARAAGIGQVNLDLMYGTPGERDEHWRDSIAAAVATAPEHLSAYALTVHPNTPFGRRVAEGSLPAPDGDTQRRRFDIARRLLAGAGFEHYELSSFALGPARRSAHNVLYWRHGDYLGVGVGAHAHWRGRRWWSHRSVERYLAAVESGRAPTAGGEVLDDDQRATERLLLGLRLREGLHPADVPPIAPVALEEALDAGLVETACGRLRATGEGWFLLDEAVRRLTA